MSALHFLLLGGICSVSAAPRSMGTRTRTMGDELSRIANIRRPTMAMNSYFRLMQGLGDKRDSDPAPTSTVELWDAEVAGELAKQFHGVQEARKAEDLDHEAVTAPADQDLSMKKAEDVQDQQGQDSVDKTAKALEDHVDQYQDQDDLDSTEKLKKTLGDMLTMTIHPADLKTILPPVRMQPVLMGKALAPAPQADKAPVSDDDEPNGEEMKQLVMSPATKARFVNIFKPLNRIDWRRA